MTEDSYIEIMSLLRRREAEFLVVRDCEDRICAMLGVKAFPYGGIPVALPSQEGTRDKRLKRSKRGNVKARKEEVPVSPVRPLKGEENAYLVEYVRGGVQGRTFQVETALVQKLVGLSDEDFQITSIYTIRFRDLDTYTRLERLLGSVVG